MQSCYGTSTVPYGTSTGSLAWFCCSEKNKKRRGPFSIREVRYNCISNGASTGTVQLYKGKSIRRFLYDTIVSYCTNSTEIYIRMYWYVCMYVS